MESSDTSEFFEELVKFIRSPPERRTTKLTTKSQSSQCVSSPVSGEKALKKPASENALPEIKRRSGSLKHRKAKVPVPPSSGKGKTATRAHAKTQATPKLKLAVSKPVSVDMYYQDLKLPETMGQLVMQVSGEAKSPVKASRDLFAEKFGSFEVLPRNENEWQDVGIKLKPLRGDIDEAFVELMDKYGEKSRPYFYRLVRRKELERAVLTRVDRSDYHGNFLSTRALQEFGSYGSESVDSDWLHLYTWHQLRQRPLNIAERLVQYAKLCLDSRCVMRYVFMWVSMFPEDFQRDKDAANLMCNLAGALAEQSREHEKAALVLRAIIVLLKERKKEPQFFSVAPMPVAKIHRKTFDVIAPLMSMNLEPSVFVDHFSYVELEHFKTLERTDLIEQTERVAQILSRFNRTCMFIASSILNEWVTPAGRVSLLSKWIDIMIAAEQLGNWQLVFEIAMALTSTPIRRLKPLWSEIPLTQTSKFTSLVSVTQSDPKQLMAQWLSKTDFTLPCIGTVLPLLSRAYKRHEPHTRLPNGEAGINMKFQKSIATAVDFLFKPWASAWAFDLHLQILDLVRDLEGTLDPDHLISLSHSLHPPHPH